MSLENHLSKDSISLERQDYEALLEVVHSIHECRNLAEFPLVVTRALARLISCNLAAYNEVNVKLGRMKSLALPALPQLPELISTWEQHMGEHPILQ